MNTHARSSPLLIWEFQKFSLLFVVLYYPILIGGGYILGIPFRDSLDSPGNGGPQFCVTYLFGVQLIGLGFGWIGFGMAAVFREHQQSFTGLFLEFMSRGPFQRTGKPSWQTAGVLFPMMFYLGYMVSISWLHGTVDIDKQTWKAWVEAFPVVRALALLAVAPLFPIFVACRALLPEMTSAEFYWRSD